MSSTRRFGFEAIQWRVAALRKARDWLNRGRRLQISNAVAERLKSPVRWFLPQIYHFGQIDPSFLLFFSHTLFTSRSSRVLSIQLPQHSTVITLSLLARFDLELRSVFTLPKFYHTVTPLRQDGGLYKDHLLRIVSRMAPR
jgi:hypothetical protein